MTKQKIRYILDYIPLFILVITANILLIMRFQNEVYLQRKHVVGIMLLPINFVLFRWNHHIGILGLGFTIFAGLFGLLSYSPATPVYYYFLTVGSVDIPLFYGQPIFVLWLAIHLVLSGKYYLGIGTKSYWKDIASSLKKA